MKLGKRQVVFQSRNNHRQGRCWLTSNNTFHLLQVEASSWTAAPSALLQEDGIHHLFLKRFIFFACVTQIKTNGRVSVVCLTWKTLPLLSLRLMRQEKPIRLFIQHLPLGFFSPQTCSEWLSLEQRLTSSSSRGLTPTEAESLALAAEMKRCRLGSGQHHSCLWRPDRRARVEAGGRRRLEMNVW